MKYFMSVYSSSRERTRNFIMREDSAMYYYNQWLTKYSDTEITRKYTSGEKIRFSDPRSRVLYIWGEDISDQEIFKRRLAGTIDQETLEE